MAEVKNIATRDSYGNALKELAAEGADKLVVLDADLSAATKTGIFKKEYPEKHFNRIPSPQCENRCNTRRYFRR